MSDMEADDPSEGISKPKDQPGSYLSRQSIPDQTQVNRAILEGLERLSQSFANFSGPDYYQAEEQD